jgi:hypothetical protein
VFAASDPTHEMRWAVMRDQDSLNRPEVHSSDSERSEHNSQAAHEHKSVLLPFWFRTFQIVQLRGAHALLGVS